MYVSQTYFPVIPTRIPAFLQILYGNVNMDAYLIFEPAFPQGNAINFCHLYTKCQIGKWGSSCNSYPVPGYRNCLLEVRPQRQKADGWSAGTGTAGTGGGWLLGAGFPYEDMEMFPNYTEAMVTPCGEHTEHHSIAYFKTVNCILYEYRFKR